MSWGFSPRSSRLICVGISLLGSPSLPAFAQQYPPLTRQDFTQYVGPSGTEAPQGFGDRQNSWAWSMAWFGGKLFVGTNRAYHCMEVAALNRAFPTIFKYPPNDPDMSCTPDYRDLPLQAEIWTWTPSTATWARVYQAPQDVPIPDGSGKTVSEDVGYRYMGVFHEPEGTDALYISGLSSKFIYGSGVNNGRLLRTVDGVNFAAVPAPPGTVLGDLSNAGFRGITTFNNKFYIIATSITGSGTVLEASDPALGGNAFTVVTPPGLVVSETEAFNGFLYMGTSDPKGFRVVKTDAIQPYTFTEVIPNGGGRTFLPNKDVWSMKVYNNRLFIGCNGVQSFFGAELYRINQDDTWDLVSGRPRTLPDGETKLPVSGLLPGFGWPLNAHMWRQEVFDDRLYVGTFDISTVFKDIPLIKNLVAYEMGFDLWETSDGTYFYAVDTVGFGDKFNFGARTLLATTYGLFLGTANYWYGLQIYLGQPFGFNPTLLISTQQPTQTPRLARPTRADVEFNSGRLLITWEGTTNAKKYHVFRSTSQLTDLAADGVRGLVQVPGSFTEIGQAPTPPGGDAPSPIPVPGGFSEIGQTAATAFVDASIDPNLQYTYYIAADDGTQITGRSNYTNYPAMTTGVRVKTVSDWLAACAAKNCFAGPTVYQKLSSQFKAAVASALKGDPQPLSNLYLLVKTNGGGTELMKQSWKASDLEVMIGRLAKRIGLVRMGQLQSTDIN